MKYAFLLLILVLSACSGQPGPAIKPVAVVKPQAAEDFDSFLVRFCSDSIFQIERIRFPLTTIIDDVDDGLQPGVITKTVWTFSDLKSSDTNYISEVFPSPESDTLRIQKKETGISVKYIFGLEKGRWRLTKIIDEST